MGVYTAPRSVLLPTTLIIKVVIHHMHLVQRLRQLKASPRPHSRPPGAVTRPLSRVGLALKHAVIPVTRAGVALHMAGFTLESRENTIHSPWCRNDHEKRPITAV